MPFPVKPGESEKDFVARCIPHHIGLGRDPAQAAAMCHAMYKTVKASDHGHIRAMLPYA